MDTTYLAEVAAILQTLHVSRLEPLLTLCRETKKRNGVVYLCGNGGSHATALHWATDLTKRAKVRTHVLWTNIPLATAYANDGTFAHGMGDEFMTLARPEDALIALSVSGHSPNVLNTLSRAGTLRLSSILLTGDFGNVTYRGRTIRVPSVKFGVVEDVHMVIGHWLTEALVETL